MRIQLPFALFVAIAFTCSMHSTPAQAQRVFVAATGSDSNPCSFASPCRSFQHAHDAAPAGGEIDVLDPAGYGALTITKAISIQAHGYAGISSSGVAAITINAGATDKVNLRGLLIDGLGIGNEGIVLNTGGSLLVQDCMVRNFTSYGIAAFPTGSSELVITNTVVSDVTTTGASAISIQPQGSAITTKVALNHVEMDQNDFGITIGSTKVGTIDVTIVNSLIANNAGEGISVFLAGATVSVMVRDSTITNNSTGVDAQVSNSTIRLAHSTITANSTGWITSSGGVVNSYGDNNIDNNAAGNTAPPAIVTK
jgi:hypothetical protein